MTEIDNTTNSSTSESEMVRPGLSEHPHPTPTLHSSVSGVTSGTQKVVEDAVHNRPVRQPRVVIVGAGFGGLRVARALSNEPVQVTVIDRQNHHLFQPLLYWVATAGLSPADICSPIRGILRKQKNTEVFMEEVTGKDMQEQRVMMGGRSVH